MKQGVFELKFDKPWLCKEHEDGQDGGFTLAQSPKSMGTIGFNTGQVYVSSSDGKLEPDDKLSAAPAQLITREYTRSQTATKENWPYLKDLERLKNFEGKPIRSGGGATDTVAAWTSTTENISPENKFLTIMVVRDANADGRADGVLYLKGVTGGRTAGNLKADRRLVFAVLAAIQPPR